MISEIPKYDIDWSTGTVRAPQLDTSIVGIKFSLFDKLVGRVMHRLGLIPEPEVPEALRKIGETKDLAELFDLFFDKRDEFLEDEQHDLGVLLSDDTIYAYAMLRWEGSPIQLRYFQDALVSDNHRRVDAEASNQSGKSFSLCVKASVAFLRHHNKNTTIGLISKSMPQNSMNMRMITKMLKEASFPYQAGSNDNMTVRVHELGDSITNTLVCAVASTSALGYPFDLLLLDEFEFWENPEGLEYMYDQVLEPRTFQTKGQIIIYSNPNGKNFVSENLHKRTIKVKNRMTGAAVPQKLRPDAYREEYQFHVYNVNFLDVPGNTQEEWDTKKRHTHPIMFASTMAALRTESEGAALTDTDIENMVDEELTNQGVHALSGKEVEFGLDLGFLHDQSVLVGGFGRKLKNEKTDEYEVHYYFVPKIYPVTHPPDALWGRTESSEQSVKDIVSQFEYQQVAFDLTGKEGNDVLARESGLSVLPIKMTAEWKATHYGRFITLAKQRRIHVCVEDNYIGTTNKNFVHQARNLRIQTKKPDGTALRYPRYRHRNEEDLDDILDALVLCLSVMDVDMTAQPGYSYVPGEKEQEQEEREKRKKQEIDDTPYDDDIQLAVENNFRAHLFGGGGLM